MIYGFVDVSGSDFGSTPQKNDKVYYRIGTWSSQEYENSSNWRKFESLACDVEEAGDTGILTDRIVSN